MSLSRLPTLSLTRLMLPSQVGRETSQRRAGEAWGGGRSEDGCAGDGSEWKCGHTEERVAGQPAESRWTGEADRWVERRDRCAGGHRPEQPGRETGSFGKVSWYRIPLTAHLPASNDSLLCLCVGASLLQRPYLKQCSPPQVHWSCWYWASGDGVVTLRWVGNSSFLKILRSL